MKKNIFVLIASTLVLSGCSILRNSVFDIFNHSKEKPNNPENQEEQKQEQEEKQGEQEEHHEDQEHSEGGFDEEYTVTIKLSGDEFSTIATKQGFQINDTDYPQNVEILKNYCASYLEHDKLLTSLNCTKLNTAEIDDKVYLCVGTGYFANDKFNQGILKWNSEEKIYKVEIKAQAYLKRNSYSGDIIDYPAHVWIEEDDHSSEVEQGSTPVVQTFTKEFNDGVNSFSIKSTGARVLLEEITITWRG